MKKVRSRSRRLLLASGLFGVGAYSYQRGLRFPRLGFESAALDTSLTLTGCGFKQRTCEVQLENFIHIVNEEDGLNFRAFAPQASLRFQARHDGQYHLNASNISKQAVLNTNAVSLTESQKGLRRTIKFSAKAGDAISFEWVLPDASNFKFAAIGDTGGGDELDWVLQRIEQLDVSFALLLGDLNYGAGEYQSAIELLKAAPCPVYVSIGNHDYNDSGLIYDTFLNQIGPLNNAFVYSGVRFVNFDTAANFLPAWSGKRGDLFAALSSDARQFFEQVFFTHRGFVDPRPGEDHVISGIGEMSWLAESIQSLGGDHVLCGHVHRSAENEYKGLKQFTTGEGLGHEDIVNQSQTSKLLVGEVDTNGGLTYQWHALDMPWSYHTSHTHKEKLIKNNHLERLKWFEGLLSGSKA